MSEDLKWNEPPTQYSKRKGEPIEEEDIPCGCEGSWGSGESQDDIFHKRTIYPFNHVYHSESGHFVEIDDNKESERISINHRTGSFVEFHPNGDRVDKIVRDSYQSIFRDSRVHVSGYSEVTIDKGMKILVNSGENENTEEESLNFDIHVGKNANINIYVEKGDLNVTLEEGNSNILVKEGDVNLRQEDGNYKQYVNGDYRLHVTGRRETIIEQDDICKIQRSRATTIEGELDYLEMTNDNGHFEKVGTQESKRMSKNITTSSLNNISRTEEQTVIETTDPDLGNLTISSCANMSFSSGWNPKTKSKSSNVDPKMYFFANENPRFRTGGEIWFSTDRHLNFVSGENTYFDVKGDQLHVKTGLLLTEWREEKPPVPQVLTLNSVFSSFINYEKIITEGFTNINIDTPSR